MTHAFLFHLQIDKNPVWADKKGRVWVKCVFDDGQEDDVTIVEAQELMRAAKPSTTPRAKRKRKAAPLQPTMIKKARKTVPPVQPTTIGNDARTR